MGDVGEDFNEHRKNRQEKKRSNLEYSTQLLKHSGIEFESKNDGVHLVVKGKRRLIDFWPSTGLFSVRGKNYKGRGVRKLINLIKHGR